MFNRSTKSLITARPLSTLTELIRLRWAAVFGQLTTIAVVSEFVEVRLPLGILFFIIGVTAISNLILEIRNTEKENGENLIFFILMIDIILFAGLLGFTGGVENPFATFYLVHLAIGSMILKEKQLWAFLLLTALSFIVLCFVYKPLYPPYTHAGKLDIRLHLQGTFIALLLASFCVAWFMVQISRSLREKESALAEARLIADRQRQLMSLATIAGGVAHEMNTPLGTIALVAGELESNINNLEIAPEWHEDIQLIRSEVNRCRHILDKLNSQSTNSVGDIPESLEIHEIKNLIQENLSCILFDQITFRFPEGNQSLLIPKEALIQSLTTLLKNGIEANTSETDSVMLEVKISGKWIEFHVSNSGPPIPKEIKEKMGDMFFSTKKQHEGMGLGLFLVRSFAESTGGKLLISSDSQSVTTISLIIPLSISLVNGIQSNERN